MNNFKDCFNQQNWESVKAAIYSQTADQVKKALAAEQRGPEEMMALLSPAADPFLEEMAQQAHAVSARRFGKTIQLYAPLYLSNECQNICSYCGFSLHNKIPRKTLTGAEILMEIDALKNQGFRHVLLVSGEAHQKVNIDYFLKAVALIRPLMANISIEFQPLAADEYRRLHEAGVHAVLVYQETYHQEVYRQYHIKGRKANFYYRLETPERIGAAGMHKIGLGVLLGLEDWRVDSYFCALHLDFLRKRYWRSRYSVSFPRMRPAEGIIEPNVIVSDRQLVQLLTAYRLFDESLDLSISTRESRHFRDHVIPLGVTTMSAGSKTNPGGYAVAEKSLEQFEISDERPVGQIAEMIARSGYDPVFKDWEPIDEKH